MTIKPGTLCIVVGVTFPPHVNYNGKTTTALSTELNSRGVLAWITDLAPLPGYRKVLVEERNLRPLNDPDSAPADPAYTRRKTHA